MFILPPNCIVPSATSLTMSPVFPNFRYFIGHTPSAANKNCDSKARNCPIHLVHSWDVDIYDHGMGSSPPARRRATTAQESEEPAAAWIVMLHATTDPTRIARGSLPQMPNSPACRS